MNKNYLFLLVELRKKRKISFIEAIEEFSADAIALVMKNTQARAVYGDGEEV